VGRWIRRDEVYAVESNSGELGVVEEEVIASMRTLARAQRIRTTITISEFLNPIEEEIDDSPEDLDVSSIMSSGLPFLSTLLALRI